MLNIFKIDDKQQNNRCHVTPTGQKNQISEHEKSWIVMTSFLCLTIIKKGHRTRR